MDYSYLHQKKLLLVDDEPELLDMVKSILQEEGFRSIITATTMQEGVLKARTENPDLIVLDIMLPDGDGFSLLEKVRSWSDVPVIFLTARDQDVDKLAGFDFGADDYIVKPFLTKELLFRIYAILRRCYREEDMFLELEYCTINFSSAEVEKEGKVQPLTAMEFKLLETLAKNEGRIVTMDSLCESLWGENPFGYENSLNAHIRRTREKIEKNPSKPVSLITIKGLGYKLVTRK